VVLILLIAINSLTRELDGCANIPSYIQNYIAQTRGYCVQVYWRERRQWADCLMTWWCTSAWNVTCSFSTLVDCNDSPCQPHIKTLAPPYQLAKSGKCCLYPVLTKVPQLKTRRASTSTRWHFAFGTVFIAMKPVHQLQTAQKCTARGPPTILPSYIRVCAVVWECSEGQTHRHRRPWPIYISRRLRLKRNVINHAYRPVSWSVYCVIH